MVMIKNKRIRIQKYLELQFTHVHHRRNAFIDVIGFPFGKVQNVESLVREFQVLVVINGRHGSFALRHVMVVINVIGKQTLGFQIRNGFLHHLVENVVGSFHFLLESDAGFFE